MGLLQGGGFGIGYGFGVRLGYDAYGHIKDLFTGKAGQARYSPDPFTSHLGSGILSALQLKTPEAHASTDNSQDAILQRQIAQHEEERLDQLKLKYPERYQSEQKSFLGLEAIF